MPINFDLKDTFDEMLSSAKQSAGESGKEARGVATRFLQNRKERLQLLAELRLAGDLNDEKFKSRLEDEKLILEAELKAMAVISKSSAQNTAQSVINIFQSAVIKALPEVLRSTT